MTWLEADTCTVGGGPCVVAGVYVVGWYAVVWYVVGWYGRDCALLVDVSYPVASGTFMASCSC